MEIKLKCIFFLYTYYEYKYISKISNNYEVVYINFFNRNKKIFLNTFFISIISILFVIFFCNFTFISLIKTSISLNFREFPKICSYFEKEQNYREFNYEIDCKKQKINNITYYYDSEDSKRDIKVCDEALDLARIKVSKYFPYKEYPMKVVILSSFDKLNKSSINNAVGLTTYPDLIIYILNTNSRMNKKRNSIIEARIDTKSTVCHEYVHFVMFKIMEEEDIFPVSSVPVWFQEGTAYYIENLYYDGYKFENYIKLKNLKYANKEFCGSNGIEYYIASTAIINHLINNYGGNRIINDILNDMKYTKDFYKSFRNVVGKTFEEIEDEVLY